MSGSSSLSADPFTDAEKVDVRRFCGYPAYGAGNSGFQSWRFFASYGTLEFRLNNLAPSELQQVRLYLSQLYPLETAILGVSANLDTAEAASWTHNPKEMAERIELFDGWRKRLVSFIGVPPGPEFGGGNSIIV